MLHLRLHNRPIISKLGQHAFALDLHLTGQTGLRIHAPGLVELVFLFVIGRLDRLRAFAEELKALDPFDAPTVLASFMALATKLGVKPRDLDGPLRVAVTGETTGFSLPETLVLLGRGTPGTIGATTYAPGQSGALPRNVSAGQVSRGGGAPSGQEK